MCPITLRVPRPSRPCGLPITLLLLCFTLPTNAAAPTTNPSLTLSIYSTANPESFDATQILKKGKAPGHALIQQRRTLDLQEGENLYDLPDLPPTADFSTLS